MTELKPCPFCGEKAKISEKIVDYNGRRIYEYMCYCAECFCSTPPYPIKDDAIKVWNKRPNPWHTGTPTEEGLYAVYYLDEHNPSATPYEVLFDGFLSYDGEGNWIDRDGEIWFIDDDIVRWQKIEPYKEKKK